MTDNLLAPLTAWVHEVFLSAWREAVHAINKALHEIRENLETKNEREKTRAYEHLITPPADHSHSKVNHSHSKPPRPARIYRRRTP